MFQEVFDAGNAFQFQEYEHDEVGIDEIGQTLTELTESIASRLPRQYDIASISKLEAFQDIFLVDHMWLVV